MVVRVDGARRSWRENAREQGSYSWATKTAKRLGGIMRRPIEQAKQRHGWEFRGSQKGELWGGRRVPYGSGKGEGRR